ncbi:unnamed protein product [Paramecium pentaurelia]|uniref:Mini antigen n=1 Tax=Paramecium pentaurelia TaxID=43138 RepID=A0A8S1T320_9CILI|nr:unnamed protein product [Paramecium pentaurelia]
MEFIIVQLLLVSSFGWIVEIKNECSCTDYKLYSECISSMGCIWNTSLSKCVDIKCNTLKSQTECISQSQYCSFDLSTFTCVPFTSCANLSGNTVQQCQTQNQMCSWVSGNSCIDYNCTNFNQNNCPYFCINTGSACENFSSCEKLNQTYCTLYSGMCYWNQNQCLNQECSNFITSTQCQFVLKSENAIVPCYWNQNQCINPPDASVYNSNQCFISTIGQYHWSSNNSTMGSCQQCQSSQDYYKPMTDFLSKGFILSIIIMGIFMII